MFRSRGYGRGSDSALSAWVISHLISSTQVLQRGGRENRKSINKANVASSYNLIKTQYTSSSSLSTLSVLQRPAAPVQSPSVLGLGLKLSRRTLPPFLEECSEELVERVDEPSLDGGAERCADGTRP